MTEENPYFHQDYPDFFQNTSIPHKTSVNVFTQIMDKTEKLFPSFIREAFECKIVLINLSVQELKNKIEKLKKNITNKSYDWQQSYKIITELRRQCQKYIEQSQQVLEDIERQRKNNIFDLPGLFAEHELKKAFNTLLQFETDIKFLENMLDVFEEKQFYQQALKRLKQEKKQLESMRAGGPEAYWGMRNHMKLLLQNLKKYQIFQNDMKKERLQLERQCSKLKKQVKDQCSFIEKHKLPIEILEQKNEILKIQQLSSRLENIQMKEINSLKCLEQKVKQQSFFMQKLRHENEMMKKKNLEMQKIIETEKQKYVQKEKKFEESLTALKQKGDDEEFYLLLVIKRIKDQRDILSEKVAEKNKTLQQMEQSFNLDKVMYQQKIQKMTKKESLLQDQVLLNILKNQKLQEQNQTLHQKLTDMKKKFQEKELECSKSQRNQKQIRHFFEKKLEIQDQRTMIISDLNQKIKTLQEVQLKQKIENKQLSLQLKSQEEKYSLSIKERNQALSDLQKSRREIKQLQLRNQFMIQNLQFQIVNKVKSEKENHELGKHLNEAKISSENLKKQLVKLQQDFIKFKVETDQQKGELKQSISSLQRENQIITCEKKSLQTRFDSYKQQSEILRKDVAFLTHSNLQLSHSLQEQKNIISQQISSLKEKLSSSLISYENVKIKLECSKKSQASLGQKLFKIKVQKDKAEQANQKLKQKYHNAKLIYKIAQDQLEQVKRMYSLGLQKYDQIIDKNVRLEFKNELLGKKVSQFESRVKVYDEDEDEEFQKIDAYSEK